LLLSIIPMMLLGTITGQAAISGVAMKEIVAQGSKDIAPPGEPELMLTPQNASMPDPRSIEFVRLLARRAARNWYERTAEEHHPKRS
jgi:hypothetical protein